jgi:hypothetical protein
LALVLCAVEEELLHDGVRVGDDPVGGETR